MQREAIEGPFDKLSSAKIAKYFIEGENIVLIFGIQLSEEKWQLIILNIKPNPAGPPITFLVGMFLQNVEGIRHSDSHVIKTWVPQQH